MENEPGGVPCGGDYRLPPALFLPDPLVHPFEIFLFVVGGGFGSREGYWGGVERFAGGVVKEAGEDRGGGEEGEDGSGAGLGTWWLDTEGS